MLSANEIKKMFGDDPDATKEKLATESANLKKELTEIGYTTRPRFSPGYGDLPIELQTDIFSELQYKRRNLEW